jgi:hypothetical protein
MPMKPRPFRHSADTALGDPMRWHYVQFSVWMWFRRNVGADRQA